MYERLKEKASTQEEALNRLVEIVGLLRQECPWDREQTHQSLRGCVIEEAYEVAEAIDKEDLINLKEELGDLVLQVVFHSCLASEKDSFNIKDVINDECEKMIRRHPHIFFQDDAKSVDKVLEKWENIKIRERPNSTHTSRLKQIPLALPALVRSYKVQKEAAGLGFDWKETEEAFAKLTEETEELLDAYNNMKQEDIEEELGDLLFSVVNVSRFLKVEPEEALEKTIEKFIRRFSYIEESIAKEGKDFHEVTLAKMDKLWNESKQKEVSKGRA